MAGSVVNKKTEDYFDITRKGNVFSFSVRDGAVASIEITQASGDMLAGCTLLIKERLSNGMPQALGTPVSITSLPYFKKDFDTDGVSRLDVIVSVAGTTSNSTVTIHAECKGDRLPIALGGGGFIQEFFGDPQQSEIPPIFSPPPDDGGLFP